MKRLEYTVRFVTPAFLGDAFQNGQWRTPPFKALLRQWWRVAEVKGRLPDPEAAATTNARTISLGELQTKEGELFGRAADQGTTSGQVRLRLDWRGGISNAQGWQRYTFGSVTHPEVGQKPGVALYLGYGPVDVGNRLKRETYLPPGHSRALTLSIPTAEEARFREALHLAHAFGSLGSRSRNGWGSLHFERGGLTPEELESFLDLANRAARDWLRNFFSRKWKDCLDADWCHAVGTDDKGLLLWRTKETINKWEDVLQLLAAVKVAFRTQFHFGGAGPHSTACDRHLLAYPVTNHNLRNSDWDRLANQILFKVLPLDGGYVGLIGHLPHGLPEKLRPATGLDRTALKAKETRDIWPKVHEILDNTPGGQGVVRIISGRISDTGAARAFLNQSLKAMTQLQRLP